MNSRDAIRARWPRLLVGGVTLGLAFAAAFVGCSLDRSGTRPQDCAVDTQCDDKEPCTVDTCGADGICIHTANDDAVLQQQKGDCRRAECKSGVSDWTGDPKDFEDDDNPCTNDSCVDGKTAHAPLKDGTSCKIAGNTGTCKAGNCEVECTPANAATKCDDAKPCTQDKCNAASGICEHTKLDGGDVPGEAQTKGDCKVKTCKLGVVAEVQDNTDKPVDMNPCTKDVCTSGVPSNPNEALAFACADPKDNLAKLCDGGGMNGMNVGKCVQCLQASDCTHLPKDDDCQKRTCTAGMCGQSFTADGTAVPLQTKGDCKQVQCDGKGKTKVVNLPNTGPTADLPDDGNDCTDDVCNAGVPSNPNRMKDSACGAMGKLYCDGLGKCANCTAAAQCGNNNDCRTWSCNAGNCVPADKPPGTPTTANPPQVSNDCKEIQCDTGGTTKVVAKVSDVPVDDGKECTVSACNGATPEHQPKMLGFSCGGGGKYCDNDGDCVECNDNTQCSAPDCKKPTCMAQTCGTMNEADGTLAPPAYQMAGDCKKKVCTGGAVDMNPVNDDTDVGSDGKDCTSDSCSMGMNVYTPLTKDMEVAGKCDMNSGCNNKPCACDGASSCKSKNGAVCAVSGDCISGNCPAADLRCCDTACTGACSACSTANGAATNGVCLASAVKSKQDSGTCDDGFGGCGGKCSCDSAGSCKKKLGETCAGPADCASNKCVDGVCCDSDCNGPCAACSMAKGAAVDGTCKSDAVKSGDDMGACDATNGNCAMMPCTCNSSGLCKNKQGNTCGAASECAGGKCVDGKCCDSDCNGPCEACSVAKGAAVDGTCKSSAVKSGDDMGACDATNGNCASMPCTCDANGACKNKQGNTCATGTDCASGNCPDADKKCCDVPCTGACEACSTANGAMTNGVCMAAAVKSQQDSGSCDDTAGMCGAAKCSCDMNGTCQRKKGEACTMAGQCATGHCVDLRCCDSACTAGCSACSTALGATVEGTCTSMAVKGMQDLLACDDGNGGCGGQCTCSSTGSCKRKLGEMCGGGGDCASGYCADGICCNDACGQPCAKCVAGACLQNEVKNMDDLGACTGTMGCGAGAGCSCNGGGMCKPD